MEIEVFESKAELGRAAAAYAAEGIRRAIDENGRANIVLATGASQFDTLASLPPGTYEVLGNTAVLEESGKLHSPEKGCLVGSSATMLTCMNQLAGLDLLGLDDLLAVGFSNPLALLGLTGDDVAAGEVLRYDPAARRFELSRRAGT